MILIEYPPPGFRIKQENGKEFLFDTLRRKWLLLSPEEWVRQNFVQYLIQVKKYPAAWIALEKEIQLGELKKRFDILVYDRQQHPWMMIECKSAGIQLKENVLEQALRYTISMPATYIIITNGSHTLGWMKKNEELIPIPGIPDFI